VCPVCRTHGSHPSSPAPFPLACGSCVHTGKKRPPCIRSFVAAMGLPKKGVQSCGPQVPLPSPVSGPVIGIRELLESATSLVFPCPLPSSCVFLWAVSRWGNGKGVAGTDSGPLQQCFSLSQRRIILADICKAPSDLWNLISLLKIETLSWALMAHACNPSYYSGGRDQEDRGSKPAWANSF
jgi:hypothetical protein